MLVRIEDVLSEFVMMWVLIDPIGTIPVFLAVTAGAARASRLAIALRAVLIAGALLLFFLLGGRLLLRAVGISLDSFQIAGGIVLFLFALTMIFGPPKAEQDIEEAESAESARDKAVFPLAIPSIASPGAMLGAVLLTDSPAFDPLQDALNISVIVVVLLATLGLLLIAERIHRLIGDSGVSVLSRIMGLILAAVAVDSVLEAVASYFRLQTGSVPGLL